MFTQHKQLLFDIIPRQRSRQEAFLSEKKVIFPIFQLGWKSIIVSLPCWSKCAAVVNRRAVVVEMESLVMENELHIRVQSSPNWSMTRLCFSFGLTYLLSNVRNNLSYINNKYYPINTLQASVAIYSTLLNILDKINAGRFIYSVREALLCGAFSERNIICGVKTPSSETLNECLFSSSTQNRHLNLGGWNVSFMRLWQFFTGLRLRIRKERQTAWLYVWKLQTCEAFKRTAPSFAPFLPTIESFKRIYRLFSFFVRVFKFACCL